jgi:hypothetical protein
MRIGIFLAVAIPIVAGCTSGNSATTFGTSGAATLYGFGPNNYGTSAAALYGTYPLPFYADLLGGGSYPATEFNGLPPAFPAPPAETGSRGTTSDS